MDSFLSETCREAGGYTDVFELCGGSARVSILLVTRKYITKGPNFDILVGINLLDRGEIEKLWAYLRRCKPACGVIATPCTGLSGFSGINRLLHHDAWLDSREVSVPLGELGAQVAEYQIDHQVHFIAENHQSSELWELPTWQKLLER